jgi:hypothetical protein
MTEAPPKREDPPASFTGFVTLLIVILFVIFLWGLNYQKVNLSLFPSSGAGLILNLIFIGSLSLILYMLFQFWLNWNFIETFQYFIVIRIISSIKFYLSLSLLTMRLCISASDNNDHMLDILKY